MKKILMSAVLAGSMVLMGCDQGVAPTSNSGVSKATATVKTGSDGLTNEQRNVKDRLEMESRPGSIKHLYIISPYSGQTILYSTVKGKVTSSGKRLNPSSIEYVYGNGSSVHNGWTVDYGGHQVGTKEPLQDDGTYGSSEPYIYWFDAKGAYHQHFFTGGQIIHISDQPQAVKSVIINSEVTTTDTNYKSAEPSK